MRISFLPLILCLILIWSCTLEGITRLSATPPVVRNFYLPLVSSVDISQSDQQWNDVEISFSISASNPAKILDGVDSEYFRGSYGKETVVGNNIYVRPWILDAERTGVTADRISLIIHDLTPGDYTVHIQTADSLENSAVFAQVTGNFFTAPEPPGTHYLTYPLTVLPAEDAAE